MRSPLSFLLALILCFSMIPQIGELPAIPSADITPTVPDTAQWPAEVPEHFLGAWGLPEGHELVAEVHADGSGTIFGTDCIWVYEEVGEDGSHMFFAYIDEEPRYHVMVYSEAPLMLLQERVADSYSYSTVSELINLAYVPAQEVPDTPDNSDPQPLKDGYLVPEFTDGSWVFRFSLESTSGSGDAITQMEILYMKDGHTVKTVTLSSDEVAEQFGLTVLEPGQVYYVADSHPIVADYDEVHYNISVQVVGGEMKSGHQFRYQVGLVPPVISVNPLKEGYLAPLYQNGSWIFECEFENPGSVPITLLKLEIRHLKDGVVLSGTDLETGTVQEEVFVFSGEQIAEISGSNVIAPGSSHLFRDGHPIVDFFNEASYTFTLQEGDGPEVTRIFLFQLDPQPPLTDYTGDVSKDLETLRHDADFSVEVGPGVYWVPANALGSSRYTNGDIFAMLSNTPEEKQAAITTLYEALQLYQIGGFYSSDDNVRIFENGLNWEHHKPGYDAVRTNSGCCATDSNWLHYILDGDYEEVGYIATSQRDGSGHVYNYIYHDGWYYIVDLTHQLAGCYFSAEEAGEMRDYLATNFTLANVHKVEKLENYVAYVQEKHPDPPGLMFRYTAPNVPPVDSVFDGDQVIITYPSMQELQLQVIFDDTSDKLSHTFATAPQNIPEWEHQRSYLFPG